MAECTTHLPCRKNIYQPSARILGEGPAEHFSDARQTRTISPAATDRSLRRGTREANADFSLNSTVIVVVLLDGVLVRSCGPRDQLFSGRTQESVVRTQRPRRTAHPFESQSIIHSFDCQLQCHFSVHFCIFQGYFVDHAPQRSMVAFKCAKYIAGFRLKSLYDCSNSISAMCPSNRGKCTTLDHSHFHRESDI